MFASPATTVAAAASAGIPGTAGGRPSIAQAAAAAGLSPAFPSATAPASIMASPAILPTAVNSTAAVSDEGPPVSSAGNAELFLGSAGMEVSPRALAAQALTGFRYTKNVGDAAAAVTGVVSDAAGGVGGAAGAASGSPAAEDLGSGNALWSALGHVENRVAGRDRDDGDSGGGSGITAASAEQAASTVADTAVPVLQPVPPVSPGAVGNLGGLASLSYLAAQMNPGLRLAMLGMLPGYSALLSKFLQAQLQQQMQAAALQAAVAAPLMLQSQLQYPEYQEQQQQQPQQQQQQPPQQQHAAHHPASTTPLTSQLGSLEGSEDQQRRQQIQMQQQPQTPAPAPLPPQQQEFNATVYQVPIVATGGHVDSGSISAEPTCTDPLSTAPPAAASSSGQQALRPELVALGPGASSLPRTAPPPEHPLPPISSPGLNLLLSQEVVTSIRTAQVGHVIGGSSTPDRGGGGDERAMSLEDDSNAAAGCSPVSSQRYRMPTFMRSVNKFRRSCDRCTLRKIKCDGNGETCKRLVTFVAFCFL